MKCSKNKRNNERDIIMLHRDEFISRLATKGYTKKHAAVIYDDFLLTLREALAAGEDVTFRGFGAFEVRERKGREGVSPQDQSRILIPPYKAVHFTPGKVLKREVKKGVVEAE